MILVRTEFQCKPGRAQDMVDAFKAMAEQMDSQDVLKRSRIMTDLSGTFDTVVVESEIESIDAYFSMLQASFADPEVPGGQMLMGEDAVYQTGQRHFYTIEATYEAE